MGVLAVEDARLELAQLAQHLGGSDVDGGVHVLFVLFHADNVAFGEQRDFAGGRACDGGVLLNVENDFRSQRLDLHDLHGITDLLLGVFAQGVGDGHLASSNRDLHSAHLSCSKG